NRARKKHLVSLEFAMMPVAAGHMVARLDVSRSKKFGMPDHPAYAGRIDFELGHDGAEQLRPAHIPSFLQHMGRILNNGRQGAAGPAAPRPCGLPTLTRCRPSGGTGRRGGRRGARAGGGAAGAEGGGPRLPATGGGKAAVGGGGRRPAPTRERSFASRCASK